MLIRLQHTHINSQQVNGEPWDSRSCPSTQLLPASPALRPHFPLHVCLSSAFTQSLLSASPWKQSDKVMWVRQKARRPPTSVWMFCVWVWLFILMETQKPSCCCGLLGSSMFSACKHTNHLENPSVCRPRQTHRIAALSHCQGQAQHRERCFVF